MTSKNTSLKKGATYAHTYLAELQDLSLAAQIRVLREARGWSQDELATRAKMAQSRISLLESADYSGRTLSTLRKLAAAYDVGLEVSFAPYYRTLKKLERGSAESLKVVSRADEKIPAAVSTQVGIADFRSASARSKDAIITGGGNDQTSQTAEFATG